MRVKGLHKSIFNISLVGFFLRGLCASGWGNVNFFFFFENVLLAGEMLKSEKPTFKNFFENVLLAGEMLKSEKPTFNISPVGGFFFAKVLLAGEMLKNCLNACASGWGNVKKCKTNF